MDRGAAGPARPGLPAGGNPGWVSPIQEVATVMGDIVLSEKEAGVG